MRQDSSRQEKLFQIRELKTMIKGQIIHDRLSLDIYRSEILCLIGASGGGKSILLKILLGLILPESGELFFEGENLIGISENKWRKIRRKISMLFQHGALFDSMSVAQNIAFPLWENGERNEEKIKDRILECLEIVDLVKHAGKMPSELSGGMKKRVALARAIAANPECILFDEPTAGLDPISAKEIDNLIKCLQADYSTTAIVITHNMRSVKEISDRVVFLEHGRAGFTGTFDELLKSDNKNARAFVSSK